jgi:hypothetical protein
MIILFYMQYTKKTLHKCIYIYIINIIKFSENNYIFYLIIVIIYYYYSYSIYLEFIINLQLRNLYILSSL